MLSTRPELVDVDLSEHDEHRALHYAVLQRRPAIVRLLVQHGADARKGIWPHRDATSPLTIAKDRGYEEIVEIIREEETKRSGTQAAFPEAAVTPEVVEAFRRGDEAALIRLFEASPDLINASDPSKGTTALHWAAACLWENFTTWLLDHGADARARTKSGQTPLDLLGSECDRRLPANRQLVTKLSQLLMRHGAERTIRWAVATGDADWVRACHAKGALLHEPDLVSLAVLSDQPEILSALLEFGFDPDERVRLSGLEETVYFWGAPLRAVCQNRQRRHGRNPPRARGRSQHERLRRKLGDVRSDCSQPLAGGAAPRETRWNRQRDDRCLSRNNRSRTASVRG